MSLFAINMTGELMNESLLRKYCIMSAHDILAKVSIALPESNSEFQKLVNDLQQEFIELYEKNGKPYGESEHDLVRYLMDMTVISVEEEDLSIVNGRANDSRSN